jgi:hypothetical protein
MVTKNVGALAIFMPIALQPRAGDGGGEHKGGANDDHDVVREAEERPVGRHEPRHRPLGCGRDPDAAPDAFPDQPGTASADPVGGVNALSAGTSPITMPTANAVSATTS